MIIYIKYEKTLSSLLEVYLGSRFDFHKRSSLIDANMEYLEVYMLYGDRDIAQNPQLDISSVVATR